MVIGGIWNNYLDHIIWDNMLRNISIKLLTKRMASFKYINYNHIIRINYI